MWLHICNFVPTSRAWIYLLNKQPYFATLMPDDPADEAADPDPADPPVKKLRKQRDPYAPIPPAEFKKRLQDLLSGFGAKIHDLNARSGDDGRSYASYHVTLVIDHVHRHHNQNVLKQGVVCSSSSPHIEEGLDPGEVTSP